MYMYIIINELQIHNMCIISIRIVVHINTA